MKTVIAKLCMTAAAVCALVATPVVASAATPRATPAATASTTNGNAPATHTVSSTGWCTLDGWGGTFYCGDNAVDVWQMPDGNPQVFVVGTDNAVWTRWKLPSGALSDWVSLGGWANGPAGVVTWSNDGWQITIDVIGGDGHVWFDHRYADGHWGGWYYGF